MENSFLSSANQSPFRRNGREGVVASGEHFGQSRFDFFQHGFGSRQIMLQTINAGQFQQLID